MGVQLGFGDVADDAVLTSNELAQRMGYAHPQSLRRALTAKGLSLPYTPLRGRYRAGSIKVWLASLVEIAPHECPRRRDDKAETAGGVSISRRQPSNVASLHEHRARLRMRMGA